MLNEETCKKLREKMGIEEFEGHTQERKYQSWVKY